MNGPNGSQKRWQASLETAAEMNDAVFITLIVTGFTVAFLHAAIPTHWLPFVVAARAQRWDLAKTLVVTGVAGSGHVLFTTALGVLVAGGGIAMNAKWSRAFPIIAGTALILVGLVYLVRQLKGSHGHVHLFGGHSHHEHGAHLHHYDSHEHYDQHDTRSQRRANGNRDHRTGVVTAPIRLGGDRRIIRTAYLFSLRSISAGFSDWLKIRLAWIRLPERGPGDCNGRWDGDLHVVNAAWVATPATSRYWTNTRR